MVPEPGLVKKDAAALLYHENYLNEELRSIKK